MTPSLAKSWSFQREPGSWLTVRMHVPALRRASGEELLRRTREDYPPPLRYGRDAEGVWLVGEYPLRALEQTEERARQQLSAWLEPGGVSSEEPDESIRDRILEEQPAGWTLRDGKWLSPAVDGVPLEIESQMVPGGVQLAATLATWEAGADDCRVALAEFLSRAQLATRFARLEWDGTSVQAVSRVEVSALDDLLPDGLQSVATVCRSLVAEVRALASPDLARAYRRQLETIPS